MPVPTIADPVIPAAPKPAGQPSQKSMTKAERRELQEKQRAAKAAAKQQAPQGQGKAQANAPKQQQQGGHRPSVSQPKPPATPMKKGFAEPAAGKHASASKEAAVAGMAGEDPSAKKVSHGLRIFAHFGQPKPVGHTVKGDIHPAIIRLGLLFSDFKICGSNARCIAMLTAFKQARCVCLTRCVLHPR
jgi:translation initiation factor eIF-2B subunit delta